MKNSHIEWAVNILKTRGYQLHTSIPEVILSTPWSEVYRFKTNQGDIFLKKVPPAISLESEIINNSYYFCSYKNNMMLPIPFFNLLCKGQSWENMSSRSSCRDHKLHVFIRDDMFSKMPTLKRLIISEDPP